MSDKIARALRTALSETLENMAFLEAFPEPEPPQIQGPKLSVSLLVHDPLQGELRLTAPHPLLAEIGEIVYALPASELSDQLLHDLLAEILNTVAGGFLRELLPDDQTFRLGLPEMEGHETGKPDGQWHFRVGSHTISVLAWGETLAAAPC